MLSQLDTTAVASVLEAVADVQLQLDPQGLCIDVSVTNPELPDLMRLPWRGVDWLAICGTQYRDRARDAFRRALKQPGKPVRVDVEHEWPDNTGRYPMTYRLVARNDGASVIAIGEDLRAVSDLRQQLLNAQQAMEQDYWALRQMENRYRRLLELTTDAIMVVDVSTLRVLEANNKATELLAPGAASIVGRPLPLQDNDFLRMLQEARDSNAAVSGSVQVNEQGAGSEVLVVPMRQGNEHRYLIRFSGEGNDPIVAEACMAEAFQRAPDAIVQIDDSGRIVGSNRIFLDWIQAENVEQILGRTLDSWLGRSTVDMSVLLNNLRERKSVKLYASVLRTALGVTSDIEISATTLMRADGARFVLFIRDTSRRVTSDHPLTEHLPRSIEQVTERVGRLPLKELVRESTDIIEALCIEAALKLTHDNRASAAEMLGLSRQSLYTKLRRYGIGEASEE